VTILIQNNAEGDALEYYVNRAAPQNLVLRLFENNVTPAETDVAASYTEATFAGYASVNLAGATWGAPSEGAPSSIAYPQQIFTSTGVQNKNVYGYYYTRAASGRIAGAERDPAAPFNILNVGDQYKVTPQITAD
jgi:hypothetical protein